MTNDRLINVISICRRIPESTINTIDNKSIKKSVLYLPVITCTPRSIGIHNIGPYDTLRMSPLKVMNLKEINASINQPKKAPMHI